MLCYENNGDHRAISVGKRNTQNQNRTDFLRHPAIKEPYLTALRNHFPPHPAWPQCGRLPAPLRYHQADRNRKTGGGGETLSQPLVAPPPARIQIQRSAFQQRCSLIKSIPRSSRCHAQIGQLLRLIPQLPSNFTAASKLAASATFNICAAGSMRFMKPLRALPGPSSMNRVKPCASR